MLYSVPTWTVTEQDLKLPLTALSCYHASAVGLPRTVVSSNSIRKQFPIRVCFAMTINKSQGQSLGRVGIYLNLEVFSHGQLYVSFSRTTDRNKLWLADDGAGEDADGKGLLDGRIRN